MTSAPFAILTVCTGNICRSPYAEAALRHALASTPGFQVASAGTGAVVGETTTDETEAAARRSGFSTAGHRARQLSRPIAASADLILTLTRDHRRDAVLAWPRANKTAFTLVEFARLADTVTDDDLSGLDGAGPVPLIGLLSRRRGLVPAPSPDVDDIEDPYRQNYEVYERMRVRVDAATASIARLFARRG